MLARAADTLPASGDYIYEVKWDGIRVMVLFHEGEVRLRGRHGTDFTAQFPELISAETLRATSGVFDGEIVCLDPDGRPHFRHVIHRMQQSASGAIERARAKHPAFCYLFDCLYLNGHSVLNLPLVQRRKLLAGVIRKGGAYRLSEAFEDGRALLEAVRQMGLEGIMAKKRDSVYLPGGRSDAWLKIKTRQSAECVVIGYTKGKGNRQAAFGALHLAQPSSDGFTYVGKVGTGFDDKLLHSLSLQLEKLPRTSRQVKEKPPDNAQSVWVEPKLMCEVAFASITPDGLLREPVFVRLRPDLTFQPNR